MLLGCGCDSVSPASGELAAMIGFDVVWGDLEHGPAVWRDAQVFCQAVKAGGALSALRIASAQRTDVLHALDVGADIVVVPMVESVQTAQQVVEYGKYAPLGKRGYAGSLRGIRYGIPADKQQLIADANRETHLFVQIETVAALQQCAGISSVKGLTGALVGPSDLSFSLGKPLDFGPGFLAHYAGAIRTIREQNQIAATVATHPDLVTPALDAGVQLIVCSGEYAALRSEWSKTIAALRSRV